MEFYTCLHTRLEHTRVLLCQTQIWTYLKKHVAIREQELGLHNEIALLTGKIIMAETK